MPDRRVAVFDIPLTQQVPDVNGVQLLGWGTEVNQILRQSSPPGLMDALIARHGRHPLYDSEHQADDGTQTMSYRIPSIYDMEQMRHTRDLLVAAVHQRTAIILDLMRMERYSELIGNNLGLGAETAHVLEVAAPKHDIGKNGIPDAIKIKEWPLTKPEDETMITHPRIC